MTRTEPVDGAPWRNRASIAVPLQHPHRQDLLHEQWQRRFGHLAHVRQLRLPADRTAGMHRTRVERRLVGDVAVSRQFSDPIAGVSGHGDADGRADLVAVHIIRSGSLSVEDTARRADLGPGTLCIRDLHSRWRFAYTAPTDCRVLLLPRAALLGQLRRTRLPALTVAPATAPESRLLLAHLDTAWALSEHLGPAGTHAAGAALSLLLTGLIGTHAATAVPAHAPVPAPAPTLRAAATAYADRRLRDPGLTPAAIARALHVSVRTLHRAFADGESVMAYVRRRRLESARRELDHPGGEYTVADVASRWQFADPSHFRRTYRNTYGQPPRRG
ncbi:helix-turn-helix transcriptional regulator [Streptomyces hyaluromycini]|uniref:helix-turn-helix transcriptional regulator n=1 Tax=Streptomyces hyaluromycini TaxID=1377993 RepID=UPI00142E004A|nr:AraC family transcriptional regulator [Streptomyces hyaluromycini]